MINLATLPLICNECRSPLLPGPEIFKCSACGKKFLVKEGHIFFTELDAQHGSEAHPDDLIFRTKNFLKKHFPGLLILLVYLVAPPVGGKPRSLVRSLPANALMINVGSGVRGVGERVVNVDIAAQSGVNVVASAYALPFQDGSVDLVLSLNVLEHLLHPEIAVAEMHRVLKKDGRVYLHVPFMYGFHSSPDDFYRWTIPGMKVLLKDFIVTDAGVAVGPTAAMGAMLGEWLSVVLSFNSKTLYQLWRLLFMILFIPLNIFDLLIARYEHASQIALAYYWIAKKR